MFNTELFVLEVQKRPSLWNAKDSAYSDRQLRLQAWDQISKVLKSNSPINKNLTIDELQKKWKHLRDYYMREKKKSLKSDSSTETDDKGSSAFRKKKKSPLLTMLQFLDANRENDVTEVTDRSTATFYPEAIDDDQCTSEYDAASPRPCKVQRMEVQSNTDPLRDDEGSSDKQFVASLLPIVKNMSAQEKFSLRTQLLNQITSPVSCIDEEETTKTSEIRKRHRTRHSEDSEAINNTKTAQTISERDEFSIYGEYVANKLRNIQNKHARHTAEFHINGILYKAEMGEYDVTSKDTSNNKSASRESSNAKITSSIYDEDSEDIFATVIKTEALD